MLAATERRIQGCQARFQSRNLSLQFCSILEQESRGIKNVDSVKRAQQKAIARDQRMEDAGTTNGPNLRWTQD